MLWFDVRCHTQGCAGIINRSHGLKTAAQPGGTPAATLLRCADTCCAGMPLHEPCWDSQLHLLVQSNGSALAWMEVLCWDALC